MVICAISHKPKTTPTINRKLKPKNNHKSASSYFSRKMRIFFATHRKKRTMIWKSHVKALHSRRQKPSRLGDWSFGRLGDWSSSRLGSSPLGEGDGGASSARDGGWGWGLPFIALACTTGIAPPPCSTNRKGTTLPQSGQRYLEIPYFCTLMRNTRPHS